MRFITEGELRDCFGRSIPESYEVPDGAKLTPAARQYLMDLRLYRPGEGTRTVSADARKKSSEREYSSALDAEKSTSIAKIGAHSAEGGAFQVKAGARDVSGDVSGAPCPVGSATGRKPEHMTHLTRTQLVCKTNGRIELRGKLDSLEAEIILVQTEAPDRFIKPLSEALELIRRTLASDVKEEPLPEWTLDGMTAEQIHRASHHPEEFGFSGHLMPDFKHGRFTALLNRLRTMARECELCAVRAYWKEGVIERGDVLLTLNRLSSYFYVLQLRAAGKE